MRQLLSFVAAISLAIPCNGIQVYSENPFYWSRDGKPVLLLGGSGDDNLFQWAGAEFGDKLSKHLDLLVSVGGNYVRNTMSSRYDAVNGYNDTHMAYPFKKLASGKYDLDQWNDDYWTRLDTFLKETYARTIFVQLELWDLWATIGKEPWSKQPWNPDNNVNYAYDNTVLKRGASGDRQPFFDAVSGDTLDPVVKRYQDQFVGRIMEATLRYDHVLYQIDNESSFAYETSDYWARFMHSQADRRGKNIYVCDSRRFRSPSPYVTTNFCDWNNPDVHHPILHQDLYNYCDIAQNGGNIGQTHYDNLIWYRARLLEHSPRPINHVKIYKFIWPTGTSWHSRSEPDETIHATQRFWRTIFGGAASARHHRNKGNWGIGLESRAQADIKSMSMLTEAMNIFRMEPDNSVLTARAENEAYLIVEAGKQFAVYFTGQADRSVQIDLGKAGPSFTKRWLDIEHSAWQAESTMSGGGHHTLTTPGPGQWAVLVKKAKDTASPANPNASAAARAVLEYFYSLPSRSDKRIVSGQFLDHGTHANLDEVTQVHRMTGHWVGMIGGDYYGKGVGRSNNTFFDDPEWKLDADWRVTNPIFIDYWKKGGLVTLCLHALNPQTGNSSWMRKHGDTINLADILTPGRTGYDVWMRQLNLIAQGLQELEDEGVVVLFRPFHEMNRNWFWWGSSNSPAEFINLWRHMFDFMTYRKKLDNLLWVYSPGASAGHLLDFYPGDTYVDIVGLDSYKRTPAEIRDHGYNTLIALGKPFGLTEFGPDKLSNWDENPRKDYDYETFIHGVVQHLPSCTHFCIWHQYYGLHFQKNAKQCLAHPWVVNRRDLPAFGRPEQMR
ncbi:MAG TPA: hypothetical protein DIU00_14450 [Phycisphaerales bacterium]|nr:hypothetical protein [Phycisphaerales bacterium]